MQLTRRTVLGAAAASFVSLDQFVVRAAAQDSKPTVKVGMSYPLSGVSAVLGLNISSGIEASFAHYNDDPASTLKIEHLLLDDAYDPSRIVSNVRKLVESDGVDLIFGLGGTAVNLAVAGYLNTKGVPHLYINTPDPQFGDVNKYPWTAPWQPTFNIEMPVFVEYVSKQKPNAEVAVLYQNDAYGQTGLAAFEEAIKGSGLTIVAKEGYLPSDPSVDIQIGKLARTNADVFLDIAIPKFAAQAIRRAAALQWKPLHLLEIGSASSELVLKPAGIEESQGVTSGAYLKDPTDPAAANDPAVVTYLEAMKKYKPSTNALDAFVVRGWSMAETLIATLKAAPDLTREGIMKSARNLDAQVGMMLVPLKTGPGQPYPIGSLYIEKFEGERFVVEGDLITPKHN